MPAEKSRGHERTRLWTVVLYPESAPQNWRDILDEQHIEWVESPLHEFDVDLTGEIKKAHWHILLSFDGPKSYEQICDLVKPLNCPIPQRVHSMRGAVRYMAHLDNPDKYQYPVSAIVPHGGFDLAAALQATSSQRYDYIGEMIVFIREHNVTEFKDLLDYALENRKEDWFPLLCDNSAFVVGQYIKSQRYGFDRSNN